MASEAQHGAASEPMCPDEPLSVSRVRPLLTHLFRDLTMDTAVRLSSDGTAQLGIGRDGFTYGETGLIAVWRVLWAVDLPSYTCCCPIPNPRVLHQQRWLRRDPHIRCESCHKRPAGATVVDLGSGVGNVVAAVALLTAYEALEGAVAAVVGVELLPPLHRVAVQALATLRTWEPDDNDAGTACATPGEDGSLPRPLPRLALRCADLLAYDLSDADVVYMASTVFESAVLTRFAARAARLLPPGARVITLASPLRHPAFYFESVVPTLGNSWGEEDAYVNVLRPQEDGPLD